MTVQNRGGKKTSRKNSPHSKASSGNPPATGSKDVNESAPADSGKTESAPEKHQDFDFPVVAVGASAGGIQALKTFFQNLDSGTGQAFVVIQHLSREYKSNLTELLAQYTEMEVCTAQESQELVPDKVFVIPADILLGLKGRNLKLTQRRQGAVSFRPINYFFEALAEQAKEKALGVILSGTGSDGTMGISAIKAAGGITFAQSENSAQFDEMPRNAFQSGDVDLVLTPAEIACTLNDLMRHPYLERSSELVDENANGWDNVQKQLKTTGLDFSQYKPSTVRRRIARRMAIHKLGSLEEYANLLEADSQELNALREDLLIKVTEFFRDPAAFEGLAQHVFPNLVKNRQDDEPIRIWVPGCATGEEVYSLAMTMMEFLSDEKAYISVQIFGTDVSQGAIEKARRGFYLESRLSSIAEERRHRFFTPNDGGFVVKKHLREMCIFASQDFTSDPPFSRVDLISCRNVLIYFSSALQKKVLPIFHYALKPDGFLMLGSSENISQASDLFAVVDKRNRIYSRKKAPQHVASEYWPKRQGRHFSATAVPESRLRKSDGKNIHQEIDRLLLRKLDPAAVLVDNDWNIVEFRGDTSLFIEHQSGKASLNLLKMTRDMLRSDLRTLLVQAKKKNAQQKKECLDFGSDQKRIVNIEVNPLLFDGETFFLVRFMPGLTGDEQGPAQQSADERSETEIQQENRRLKEELASSQDYVQQVVEEKNEALEDLRAANEEILSSNEELQSINEEIETAKEELESSNEELSTVNQELQHRNEELNQSHNDLSNLISSVQIPFVIVNCDMKIRRVSDDAEERFQVSPGDVGRPLSDLTLSFDIPDLKEVLQGVIESKQKIERDIQDRKGRWNMLRIRPYTTDKDNEIEGAVLALFDVDQLKRNLEEIEKAYKFSLQIVDTIKTPLLVIDDRLRVKKANPAFYQKFQVSPKDTEGAEVFALGSGQWDQSDLRRLLKDILPQSVQMDNYQVDFDFPHLGPRIMTLSARKMPARIASSASILLIIEDVTEQKQSENYLRQAKQAAEEASRAKSEFLATISHEIRTPITVILSAVELMQDSKLDNEQQRCMTMAEKSTVSLLELLNDILDFSKIEVDKITILSEPFDVRQNVEEMVEIMRGEAARKGLSLDLKVAKGIPRQILGDWKRLRQVLVNLVGNAIKFTEVGKVEIRLDKSSQLDKGEYLMFAVSDTGIGIADENIDKLFQTFCQVDSSSSRKYGGTGLGLAICKGLVKRMGGSIWVDSKLGQGSTFYFTLPLRKAPAKRASEGRASEAPTPTAEAYPKLPPAKILLVDDDVSIRALTSMILRNWGLEVTEAENGAEVLELFHKENPDLILMDLQMPGEDGFEVTEKLRSLEEGRERRVPIVAFTAHARKKEEKKCLEASMDAVVTKPIDRDKLFVTMEQFLRKKTGAVKPE